MMGQFTKIAILLKLLVLMTLAPAIFAQTPEEIQHFEELLQKAAAAQESGDLEAVVSNLIAATEIVDHPRLYVEIAQAFFELERCMQAREWIDRVLAKEDVPAPVRLRARELVVEVGPCTGELIIDCQDVEARIVVRHQTEDVAQGTCPFRAELPTGVYTLEAVADGYEDEVRTIEVQAGVQVRDILRLVAVEETPAVSSHESKWRLYTGIGASVIGAGALGYGIYLESQAPTRRDGLAASFAAGDQEKIDEWTQFNQRAYRATLGMFIGGGIFLAAGTGLIVWHFIRDGDEAEQPLTLLVGPTDVGIQVRF